MAVFLFVLVKFGLSEKMFKTKFKLTSHKRNHKGVKPYNWHFCQKTFAYLACLNTHKHSLTGEMPFKCGFCEKTFKQLADLTSHKRSHTALEKSYFSLICVKSICAISYFTKHKLSPTREMPFKCDICKKIFKTY